MKKGLKWMAGLLTLTMVVGSLQDAAVHPQKETAAGESAAATQQNQQLIQLQQKQQARN